MNTKKISYHWKVNAVSVCGSDHEKVGGLCQDSHYFMIINGDTLISAVADGAGSAVYGGLGAELAVETSIKNIVSKLGDSPDLIMETDCIKEIIIDSFRAVIKSIEEKAEEYNAIARDFATTLSLVIANPDMAISAQIGDGATIINDDQDNMLSLTKPQFGEYINETIFIISQNAIDRMQLESFIGVIKNVAIISDGLQMLALKMPEGTPHAPFFMPLFRYVSKTKDDQEIKKQLESLLQSKKIRERSSDDITLFLATLEKI